MTTDEPTTSHTDTTSDNPDADHLDAAWHRLSTEIERLRQAAGLTQREVAHQIGYTRAYISRAESGTSRPSEPLVNALDRLFNANGALNTLYTQAKTEQQTRRRDFSRTASGEVEHVACSAASHSECNHVEAVRQELHDSLGCGAMGEASIDDWERIVFRYGRATRHRPADLLVADLTADLAELNQTIAHHRSASTLRRLTRVAAHLCGLMCLTLCKLDERMAFRRWSRTARMAASEAGDPVTLSWVLAQESYGHYYSGDLNEAIDVARHAQDLVRTVPCVGAALAAALEARAHAAMGRHPETREALSKAEHVLSNLQGAELDASAFGYNEAQLRFHEGNSYTNLGDPRSALVAQERALDLCAPGDYTDWAMTRLDRASCLAYLGDVGDGIWYATQTLAQLTERQRKGIITARGHDFIDALSEPQRALPAARDLRDLLALTTEKKGRHS